MKKSILICTVAAVLLLCLVVSVFADSTVNLFFYEQELKRDVSTTVVGGRVLAILKHVLESLGAAVTRDRAAEDGLRSNAPDANIHASGKLKDSSLVSLQEAQEQPKSTVYENMQYGFRFSLPKSWENYTIVKEKWEGVSIVGQTADTIVETGPVINIRHPMWTSQNPWQDIPIMIFTLTQWDSLQRGEFHIGTAPTGPRQIGCNSKYVFAIPARYNYGFLTGFEEVEKILEDNPLEPLESIGPETTTSNIIEEDKNEMPDSVASNQDIADIPSLGGISLGDSLESVANALGNNYTESAELDNAGFIGEDISVLSYESGIVVHIGKTSGKVLRVSSTSPDLQTDLGIKVGDDAKTVFEAYKPKFKEAISRHSDEVLAGWFLIGDGAVIIFDFDKSDSALVNSSITPDSRVEGIILAYWQHFD